MRTRPSFTERHPNATGCDGVSLFPVKSSFSCSGHVGFAFGSVQMNVLSPFRLDIQWTWFPLSTQLLLLFLFIVLSSHLTHFTHASQLLLCHLHAACCSERGRRHGLWNEWFWLGLSSCDLPVSVGVLLVHLRRLPPCPTVLLCHWSPARSRAHVCFQRLIKPIMHKLHT